ncbi:MAG: hypothetical protein A2580_17920 [Hydrogenophilales bacterium RIFOXYD1_FULL_62_11]|nr:MAG: hypothetical protein A2580_17920 [Hydrogenophilales bacterium RIFOXYD1_FULL_62_11]
MKTMHTDTRPAAHWYTELRAVQSLGSSSDRPGSLAGLAAARRKNLGQFFTGDDLAALVWQLGVAGPSAGLNRKVSILDNSVGSARLLQFADPDKHYIAGCDVHGPTITALIDAAESHGLDCDLVAAGMESIRPSGFDVALINPPFSLALDSATLQPYSCTTYGRFGPSSAAISHAYALHQALDAARLVVAILPSTYARECFNRPTAEMTGRLRAIIDLPAGSFSHEGTQVSVSLLVFGEEPSATAPRDLKLLSLADRLPCLDMVLPERGSRPRPISTTSDDSSEPSITGPVTGNREVRIVHRGRQIYLKFKCAFMQAKVLNHVLVGPVRPMENHRYPKGVRFQGQGKLDVEVMLLQPDPMGCLRQLEAMVADMGGVPNTCASLRNYLVKRIRRHARESTPFGHVVKGDVQASDAGKALARRKRLLDPAVWGSPLIKAGDSVDLSKLDSGDYLVTVKGSSATMREDQLLADFELPRQSSDSGWSVASPPRAEAFPQLAHSIACHLRASGAADVASWDYQLEDMVEIHMGRNALAAWRMGCGKGRLAIALALAGGRHNAIVVESHLIDELLDQLRESNVDPGLWQVITKAGHCEQLRRINIISYNRLRMELTPGAGRRTFASRLRRRFSWVISDEVHLLRNTETAQSRALMQLSPRRRVGMTGTPIANYVQNVLPVVQWVYGDGTALQPFGRRRAYLEQRLWTSMSASVRGVDEFANRHVVTEWVTRAWEDGMQVGAKRQVPKIAQLDRLRAWSAPLLKRRHETEPMVAAHFHVPEPTVYTTTLDWDDAHLAHYIKVADEFANWFRDAYKDASNQGRNLNLIALLARIGAVERACNIPQRASTSKVRVLPYAGLTSKQRYVLDRLATLTEQGHKTVCYVDGPTAVRLFVAELAKRGIEAVPFHGDEPIKARTRRMNERFRKGPAPVLVASRDTIQNGFNLWQADRAILACRSWTHTQEDQLMRRLLRPQQTRDVEIELVNMRGSIDEYQAQMTQMKGDCAGAALDFLTPSTDNDEFIHLDQILNRMVADLAERSGFEAHEYRKQLQAA